MGILRLPLIILYVVVILDLFLLSSRVGKFNDDIILVTLLNLEKIVVKSGCSSLDGLKLVYVGVGVRGPDRGCIFNNGAYHHITIVLNRNRAVMQESMREPV